MVATANDKIQQVTATAEDPIGRYERAKTRMREARETGQDIIEATDEFEQARNGLRELFESIWPG